ncbi:MAG: hypothetical protein ACTHKT_01205 [Solirubrobacterales bacterium]
MHKKIIMACMAIAAFAAFVIAPVASAAESPTLTSEGVSVPKGTKITGTNTGEAKFTGGGTTVSCDHVILTGEVTKNEKGIIEGKITTRDYNGTGTSTDCTSNLFNAPVGVTVGSLCTKTAAVPADVTVTTGCGAAVTFTLNFTGVATCKYSRSEVTATFTTGASPVTVNPEEESKLVEGGSLCPAAGKLDMTYDLWTDGTSHLATNTVVVS